MRKSTILLPFAFLAFFAIVAAGCAKKSPDVRHQYPSEDEERNRPNSDIPQLGTDGFEDNE